MKKQLQLFTTLLALICLSFNLTAQIPAQLHVFENWTATDGVQAFYYKSITKTFAGNGDVIVAGSTINAIGNDYDILLVLYNSKGDLQWMQQWDGGYGNDGAVAMVIDGNENIFITGIETDASGLTNVITQKYDVNGSLQWSSSWDDTYNLADGGADLQLDSGNVYVTGFAMNNSGNTDFATIKYNSSGTFKWARTYDYSSHLNDGGFKIMVNSAHKVFVTGGIQTGASTYKCAVIEYSNGGGYVTITVSGSTSTSYVDIVNDVATDATKHIYIAGGVKINYHGYDYCVIKLDSLLNIVWEKHYNTNDSLDDVAKSLAVDDTGNVYVTGFTTSATQQKNYTTQKYNSSGTLKWTTNFNDSLNGSDEATALILNSNDEVIITGNAQLSHINGQDYYTIKYDNAGNEIWNIYSDSYNHQDDYATCLAIDLDGNIEVTGQITTAPGKYDYRTIQYVEKMIVTPDDLHGEAPAGSFLYYHNRGQLVSADSVPVAVPEQVYYTNNTSPALYIQENSFSFVFAHVDTVVATQDTLHRIDVAFNGAQKVKTYPMEEQPSYLNYFLPQCPDGITEIHGNQRLVTPDLYPNIDLIYYSNNAGFKYYFVVKPGGDPRNIEEFYDGASSTSINGTTHVLNVNSSIGSISFQPPKAYQLNSGGGIVTLTDSIFDWTAVATDTYQFDVGTFDNTKVLVIEVVKSHITMPLTVGPNGNLYWSTYYGGGGELYLDIKSDKSPATNNKYITGYSEGIGFPYTNGVIYPTQQGGATDAVVIKFDDVNNLSWATYFGGSEQDVGQGVVADAAGNVYITGHTNSTDLDVQNPGGEYLDPTNGCLGGCQDAKDMFIVRLDPAAIYQSQMWCTYYGGDYYSEFGNDIEIDGNGNIFVVGGSTGNSTYLYQNGYTGYETSGGGLILEFTPAGVLEYASFMGGSNFSNGDETNEINTIRFDASNNIYFIGTTTNNDYPVTNASTYSGGPNDEDAVVTSLDVTDHTQRWSTYYGGDGDDIGWGLALDQLNHVFVTGETHPTNSISFPFVNPAGGAYFRNSMSGVHDGYIGGFDQTTGNLFWSSYLDGVGNSSKFALGNSICTDDHNYIYIVGVTNDQSFPTQYLSYNGNPGYNQSTMYGGADALIMGFNPLFQYIWGTYFGGDGYDVAVGCMDHSPWFNGELYVVGYTWSTETMTNPFPLVDQGTYFDGVFTAPGILTNGFVSKFKYWDPYNPMSINEDNIDNSGNIICFPNPAMNELNVVFNLKSKSEVKIEIVDVVGQILKCEKLGQVSGTVKKQISIDNISDGIYFIKVVTDDNTLLTKFLKQ